MEGKMNYHFDAIKSKTIGNDCRVHLIDRCLE